MKTFVSMLVASVLVTILAASAFAGESKADCEKSGKRIARLTPATQPTVISTGASIKQEVRVCPSRVRSFPLTYRGKGDEIEFVPVGPREFDEARKEPGGDRSIQGL